MGVVNPWGPKPKKRELKPRKPRAETLPLKKLRPEHHFFVDEFAALMDVNRAAVRAGFLPQYGHRLLTDPLIQERFAAVARNHAKRAGLEQDYVLNRLRMIVDADPRELSEHWRVPCRFCWGDQHHYQYADELEELDARRKHQMEMRGTPPDERYEFDDLGGYGYTFLKFPMRGPDFVAFVGEICERQARALPDWIEANSDHTCPRCSGLGESHVILHDTRYLSENAKLLYLGTKITQRGAEIVQRDQDKFYDMLGRHLNLFQQPTTPIPTLDPALLEPDHIETVLIQVTQRLARDDPDALRALAPPEVLEGVDSGEGGKD